MTTLAKLQSATVDRGELILWAHKSKPADVVTVFVYGSSREFEDGLASARGRGDSLEAAIVDLLGKMGVEVANGD